MTSTPVADKLAAVIASLPLEKFGDAEITLSEIKSMLAGEDAERIEVCFRNRIVITARSTEEEDPNGFFADDCVVATVTMPTESGYRFARFDVSGFTYSGGHPDDPFYGKAESVIALRLDDNLDLATSEDGPDFVAAFAIEDSSPLLFALNGPLEDPEDRGGWESDEAFAEMRSYLKGLPRLEDALTQSLPSHLIAMNDNK